jgi:hypothetical protein
MKALQKPKQTEHVVEEEMKRYNKKKDYIFKLYIQIKIYFLSNTQESCASLY